MSEAVASSPGPITPAIGRGIGLTQAGNNAFAMCVHDCDNKEIGPVPLRQECDLMSTCDVLVIGGGPAGATVAALLSRAGWDVVVVERQTFPRKKVCGEFVSASAVTLLDRLGVGTVFRKEAGPEVRDIGLFVGDIALRSPLPFIAGNGAEGGRALSRERLDTLLLQRAREFGAVVRQPAAVHSIDKEGVRLRCRIANSAAGSTEEICPRMVIAAHGSWHSGLLPTQPARCAPAPSDLFGFKAHFRSTRLPRGLMPLLAFPGGYAGMVQCERGRVSLSCCIRRDRLARIRKQYGKCAAGTAGDAVQAYIENSCRGVRAVLAGAAREGRWLAAGPIRPGIRLRGSDRVLLVGNAAGEAHPVIAEGITLAIQSAWLLAEILTGTRDLASAGREYASTWQRRFTPRILLAQFIAHWAMNPHLVGMSLPLLRWCPQVLGAFACWAGK